jgi:hypothetical protein
MVTGKVELGWVVTGKTYLQAKRFFLERIFLPTDRKPHTRHYQLRHALQKLGITTEKRPFRHWCTIETNAIVPMNRRRDGGWHWVKREDVDIHFEG